MKFDLPLMIDFVNEKLEEHGDDSGYWSNTGPGKHLEDDIMSNPAFADMTLEERKELVRTLAGALTMIGIMSCLVCLCMTAAYGTACCMCLKDLGKDRTINSQIRNAVDRSRQRVTGMTQR